MKIFGSPPPSPPSGAGVHFWEFAYANWARNHGLNPQQAVSGIMSHDGAVYRRLSPKAVHSTVEKVFSTTVEFDPLTPPAARWVAWDKKETARIHGCHPVSHQCLTDASPTYVGGLSGRDVLSQLFPDPEGMLCIGRGTYDFFTSPLRGFPVLGSWEFIVPHYMTSKMGLTVEGKLSYHAKSNTGAPRFIVFDFDDPPPEEHASIIMHLSKFRPLTMALSSGGKSLHAWFPTTPSASDDDLFWRLGITLGADPAIKRNSSQFVRLPMGTRSQGSNKGTRQRVLYFNPKAIPQ